MANEELIEPVKSAKEKKAKLTLYEVVGTDVRFKGKVLKEGQRIELDEADAESLKLHIKLVKEGE